MFKFCTSRSKSVNWPSSIHVVHLLAVTCKVLCERETPYVVLSDSLGAIWLNLTLRLNCYLKYLSIINSSLLTMKFISIILELSLTSIYISQLQDLDQWVTKPLYCGINCLWLKRMTSSTAFKCNIKKYLMSLYWNYICIFKFNIIPY